MFYLKIEKDLYHFKDDWIIIYGSRLTKNYIPCRSDTDIALLSQLNQRDENLHFWSSLLGKIPPKYDFRIFELLPIHIIIDIMKNYEVIFGNNLEISEYLYSFWKIWKDIEPPIKKNQFKSMEELSSFFYFIY